MILKIISLAKVFFRSWYNFYFGLLRANLKYISIFLIIVAFFLIFEKSPSCIKYESDNGCVEYDQSFFNDDISLYSFLSVISIGFVALSSISLAGHLIGFISVIRKDGVNRVLIDTEVLKSEDD